MVGLKLKEGVGPSQASDPEDTVETKKALQTLGHYPTERTPSPWPDTEMFDGLKKVQKKHGLWQDGVARAGGPTQWMINADLKRHRTGQNPPASLGLTGTFDGTGRRPDLTAIARPLRSLNLLSPSKMDDDNAVAAGLGRFQLLTDLKHDRVARPKGPTEQKLAQAAWGTEPDKPVKSAAPKVELASFRGHNPASGSNSSAEWAIRKAGETVARGIGVNTPQRSKKSQRAESVEPSKQIKWNKHHENGDYKPEFSTTNFLVKGPVQLERTSVSLSPSEGGRYFIEWRPLRPDGTLEDVIVDPNYYNTPRGGFLPLFGPSKVTLNPPSENKHGWELRLTVPPQPMVNGNSAGVDYRVRLPEGEKQLVRAPFPRDWHEIE